MSDLHPPLTLPASAEEAPHAGRSPLSPEDDAPEIPFDPVPRLRIRRRGWTPDRQRGFIAALARCGSVSAAARHVGMSARTAYRLLDAPGANSFAAAWDAAVDQGVERTRSDALQRAFHGAFVPVYRRGKLVRVEHRRCDRLAIALLSGRDRDVADHGRAVRRRAYHEELRVADEARAEARRSDEARATAYRAELAAMVERGEAIAREQSRPRLRRL